ncbi:uncharacterized protein LOC128545926 [Mercenaria mercenaria]|uniref:uncharacterized protein LOC128545926 n=1 Tax=Mercenaria mercenaria TaxID=6596 RepID=UPI00234F3958|nr:uncharacterized protein LOC128545926 [Mercenaria mercenaria]
MKTYWSSWRRTARNFCCKIDKVKQVINAENCQGTSLFIHSVECKPDVLNSERALAQLKLKNNIEKSTFVPDKQFFNIVASKTKLGEMADPAFVDVKQQSHATIDKTPDEKIQRKQLTETKEVMRSNAGVNGAHARPLPVSKKDGEIVFETYYHQSGKEFQCIYQNGTRYYLADSEEWLEFPKHWYIEGVLMTKSVLKDDSTEINYRKK